MNQEHNMSEVELTKAENRTAAARIVFGAKLEEYLAIISVGTPKDRENARNHVIFALEVMLDLQEEHMRQILMRQGINPMTRHYRE